MLKAFLDLHIIQMAGGLLVAAIFGTLAGGVVAGRGINRLAIGIGMLPRGEVGLIFAAIGKSLDVINDALFSSVALMVIFTTLVAPPLLKWALKEPLIDLIKRADARRRRAKKRSLHGVNEHFEPGWYAADAASVN